MKQLKNALLMYYFAKDGDRGYLLDEIIELSEKILNKCNDNKIRESAIRDLVFVYPRVGKREKARKLAEEQPSMYMCKEHFIKLMFISLHYLMKLFHKYIIHILKILIKWEVYLIK